MRWREVDALAGAIASEARRLQSLLTRQPRQATVFDLADAVGPAMLMTRSAGVTVANRLSGPTWVHGSRDDIAQAVLALLDNARVHAAPSPVEVRVTVVDGIATLYVEDRGPGIDPASAERIFWRGRRSAASFGSGLGLYIARQLVTRHGGCLSAAPRPDGGASFALSLRSAASHPSTGIRRAARRPELVP